MCELQPNATPSAHAKLAGEAQPHGPSLLTRHLRARSLPDSLPYKPPEPGLGQEEQPSPPAGCLTMPVPCPTTAQAGRACGGLRHRAGAQLQRSGQMRSGHCTKWLLCSMLRLQASARRSPTATAFPPCGTGQTAQGATGAGGPQLLATREQGDTHAGKPEAASHY